MKTVTTHDFFLLSQKTLFYFIPVIILTCGIFYACSSDDEATTTGIQGSVTDEQGNSYMNVELTLQPENAQAVTDISGIYSFDNINPGSYEVLIDPPNSSEVLTGNVSPVTLNEGQTESVNFILKMLPVEASLAIDGGATNAILRNGQGSIPTEPDELLFKLSGGEVHPILAPDGHQVTLQEWIMAGGTSNVNCNGSTTNYNFSLTGLIPNGVYTIWNNIYSSSKRPGSDIINTIAGGAMGPADGSANVFTASVSGEATLNFGVSGGTELSFFGEQPDCALTEPGLILVVLYHIDGLTYGGSPGPTETVIAHLLFYY